jgi:preprotein translocase subunit SecD
MSVSRRKAIRLYVPASVITLVLLYLALLGVQSSTAEMMPGVMVFEATQAIDSQALMAASRVLEQRLSASLPDDARLTMAVEDNHLVISLPTDVEPSVAVAAASRVGQVELVDGGTEFLPIGSVVKTGLRAIPDQNVYEAVLTSADFEAANARLKQDGRPVIEFILTSTGDARLAAHTAELRGYYLCLAVDSRVLNCPILRTPLANRRGSIELTGNATLDDAHALADLIRSGPLPVPLKLAGD